MTHGQAPERAQEAGSEQEPSGAWPEGSLMRLVVALALRTNTMPSWWLAEPDGVLDTALELLREQDEATAEAMRGRGSR